jgi:hypothetical protein
MFHRKEALLKTTWAFNIAAILWSPIVELMVDGSASQSSPGYSHSERAVCARCEMANCSHTSRIGLKIENDFFRAFFKVEILSLELV